MPLPPVHILSVLLLYFRNKRHIDPLAIAASATIIDLEPLYYMLNGEPFDHRIWHGYAFALTIYPILVASTLYFLERLFKKQLWFIYTTLWLKPEKVQYPMLNIYLCCLIGGFSHILLDMFVHETMPYVIYPIVYGNPFYLGETSGIVELIAVALAAYTIYLWLRTAKTQQ